MPQHNISSPAPVFHHAALRVRDVQASGDFYERVMGLARIPDPFNDGQHRWFLIGEYEQLHLIGCAVGGGQETPGHHIDVHLAFRVGDMAVFTAHLDQTHLGPRSLQTRADGVRQVYLQDPDGYWIEVNDARS